MLNKIQFQTKQIKKFIFTIIIIACNSMVNAQDANEIQVYASATTPKYMTIIELHSNYTFKGPKSNEKYHPLLETIEITTGVTKDFEVWVDELINTNETFVTEAGDVEKWDGSGKTQLLKYKEEALEYLKKQKKE